jgi:hypothetical protein
LCDCSYAQNLLMQYAPPPAAAAGQAGQAQQPPTAAAQAPSVGMQPPAAAAAAAADSGAGLMPHAAEVEGRARLSNGTGHQQQQQQLLLQQGADSRVSGGHQQGADQQRPDAPALDLLAGAVAAVEAAGEQGWSPS